MKNFIVLAGFIALMSGAAINAQVTIGKDKSPETFSVLELISNDTRGLRLPQLTTQERDTLDGTVPYGSGSASMIAAATAFIAKKTNEAMGLQIFNTSTKCVETWNGTAWILKCAPIIVTYSANGGSGSDILVETESSYVAGNSYTVANNTFTRTNYLFSGWNTAANGSGTPYNVGDVIDVSENMTLFAQWVTIPVNPPDPTSPPANTYVGAFWKNSQTGERLIRIPVETEPTNLGGWSAIVVDGNFIILDTKPSSDTYVTWATPDNASIADMNDPAKDALHQVSGNATAVSGSVAANGYIYFRIGLTDANPGSAPRYGRILLTYGGTNTKQQFLYIRQGEKEDYVFTPADTYDDPSTRVSYPRIKAVKFSPYNLTAADLPDGSPYYKDIASGSKGIFVDYPTKAGASFQWASTTHPLRAYHPTASIASGDWSYESSISGYWTSSANPRQNNETCPSGFRRPNDGITDNAQLSGSNNISVSEMRQSLYAVPQEGTTISNHSGNNRYWGYYADGYFDRRAITYQNSSYPNTAVSPNTKDVAYIGVLYTNPASGASLFTPAAGSRYYTNGTLNFSGYYGYYWSSSSYSTTYGWSLSSRSSNASQNNINRSEGSAVRCVSE
jgi:uncharacterized repeat protein (TIGR02543 family)